MDTTVTETLRPSLTVSDPDVQLTVLSGAAGPTGPAGPNAITSSTSSDGTINLSVNSLTTGTVSATGNISGSAGDFTTLAVGSSDQFSVSSAGDVGTSGNVTLSDGDVVATVGDITALAGNISAPNIFASADLGYSSGGGGVVTQGTSITTGVTLNAPSGVITCFAHSYPANDAINFTLNNTAIGANDVVIVSLQNGDDSLSASVTSTATGSCDISIRNGLDATVAPASLKVNFAVIKVATS
tara:strand:- start:25 stop:750 length:726 start_codon:yes stop_codon:yes gene_type:complete